MNENENLSRHVRRVFDGWFFGLIFVGVVLDVEHAEERSMSPF
jgi:hypothetical protein